MGLQTGLEIDSRAGEARDSAAGPGEGNKRLVFKVGEFSLSLEIGALRRVHDAEGLPPRTAGTRVIDLHHLAGVSSERPVAFWLELEIGGAKYLMPVEEVEGIGELAVAIPLDYPRAMMTPRMRYIQRLLFDGMRMIVDLNPLALAESAGAARSGLPLEAKAPERPAEAKGAAALSGQVLVFESGGRELKVDMGLVVSIIGLDYVFAVPRGEKPIRGVVYHADQAVPVIDPRVLLSGKGAGKTAPPPAMAVLVETPLGMVGIEADRVARVAPRSEAPDESEAPEIGPEKLIAFLA